MMNARKYVVSALVACAFWLAAGAAHASTKVKADFNGDGFEDLAIGVPGQTIAGDVSAGAVNVIYGSANGLVKSTGKVQVIFQDQPGILREFSEPDDFFGSTLAAGNFNGDAFDDLAIGVPLEDLVSGGKTVVNAGMVHILFGSPLGLTDSNDQIWDQDSPGVPGAPGSQAVFANALAAGDFNKDGVDDLAIGVPGQSVNGAGLAGAVITLYGSLSGLTATGSQFLTEGGIFGIPQFSELDDQFGFSLAAGDFGGDGFDDLAIGAPREDFGGGVSTDPTDRGQVIIILGSPSGLNASLRDFFNQDKAGILDDAEPFDRFGIALASGDFNGDGRDDLAIGVPFEDLGGSPNSGIQNAGVVEVIYGSPGGLTAVNDQRWSQESADFVTNTFIIDQGEANDKFGGALAAGDFNGDGRDDLAVGVAAEDADLSLIDTGGINVIFGSPTGLAVLNNQFLDSLVFNHFPAAGDRFGLALAGQGNRPGSSAGFSGEWISLTESCVKDCRLQGQLDVTNPGTGMADPSVVRFYLSMDQHLDASDALIAQMGLNLLAPGGTAHVRLRSEPGGSALGQFVIAVLDATNRVPEINEANNIIVSEAIH